MRLEKRRTMGSTHYVVLIAESEEESKILDDVFGECVKNSDGFISDVKGELCLSDGYGEHHIKLYPG